MCAEEKRETPAACAADDDARVAKRAKVVDGGETGDQPQQKGVVCESPPPAGCRIEVLWLVEGDGAQDGNLDAAPNQTSSVWWPATVMERADAEGERETAGADAAPSVALRYAKYGAFEEEQRVVNFVGPHLLVDLSEGQELEWRREGEDWEPDPDPVVTIEELAREEAEGGADAAGVLGSLTYDRQIKVAEGMRKAADFFKTQLHGLLRAKGDGHVVTAKDIKNIIAGANMN